jgi:hypothetical protein
MNEKHKLAIAEAKKRKDGEKLANKTSSVTVSRHRKILELLGALLFTAVGMTTSLPTSVAIPIWTIAFLVFLYVSLDTIPYADKFSIPKKILLCGLVTLLCLDFSWLFLRHRVMKEKAGVLSGYIAARNPKYISNPVVEFGDSGLVMRWWDNSTPLHLLKDAGLVLETGNDGIEISTIIRDRFGRRVMTISKNRWMVEAHNSIDKNFTDDALEVLDEGGHVVFQVRMLPDRIQLRGEWHDEFGNGRQITECRVQKERSSGCIQIFGPKFPEEANKINFEPIFEYPSAEHLGEFRKKK